MLKHLIFMLGIGYLEKFLSEIQLNFNLICFGFFTTTGIFYFVL